MDDGNVNRTLVEDSEKIVHRPRYTFEELREKQKANVYTCMYCGREFNNKGKLGWHLSQCVERAVRRDFHVGRYVYSVYLNPRKDILASLLRIARDLTQALEMPDWKKEERFLGAILYAGESRYLRKEYMVIKRFVPGMKIYFPHKTPPIEPTYIDFMEDIKNHKKETEQFLRACDGDKQAKL